MRSNWPAALFPLYNLVPGNYSGIIVGLKHHMYRVTLFRPVASVRNKRDTMLTFNELLSEIKQRSPSEQLILLEELAHNLRHELIESKSQPDSQSQNPSQTSSSARTPEELGWPPGYFETVPGSIPDLDFKRHPQGEYPVREEFD